MSSKNFNDNRFSLKRCICSCCVVVVVVVLVVNEVKMGLIVLQSMII